MNPIAPGNNPALFLDLPPSPAASASQCSSRSAAEQAAGVFPLGLCTPPTDEDMAATYEVPHMASCENYPLHHSSSYAPTIPQSDRRRPALNERPVPNEQMVFNPISRCAAPLANQTQPRASSAAAYRPTASTAAVPKMARSSTAGTEYPQPYDGSRQRKQLTPTSGTSSAESAASAKMTNHSMSIPERISTRGGNISDFMAEVAALFWFESTKLLDKVEKMPRLVPSPSIQPLPPTAVASQHFKKWVSTVLTTTQVTQNVVILALLYIHRLKKANPTVKGRPGSEYRLLTVALMLGNKFLDDNTYTNKTWADVSGISVNEIHVMEVEFLSNMRYSLLVSADEWEQWLDKLTAFWSYLELAQQTVSPTPSPLLIPSPTHLGFVSPLHSPTVPLTPGLQSTAHSFTLQSPSLGPLAASAQTWPVAYGGGNAASPLALKPEPYLYRKRSFPAEDSAEPPAKRVGRIPLGQGTLPPQPQAAAPVQYPSATSQPQQFGLPHPATVPPVQSRSVPGLYQERPQVPSLTLNTAQAAAADVGVPQVQPPYGAASYVPQQASLSLPPLSSGVRAMAMVYPITTYAPSQPISAATCGSVTPTTSFPPMSYGTPTKRLSPQSALVAYPTSSPLVMGTPMGNGSTSGLHTPISHSPSIYLQQRNSPYRPVRHVNTLLYPPPSAFLQQYHLPNPVLPNQMHYQPLGKRNEYRTGIVPEFLDSVRLGSAQVAAAASYHHQQQHQPVLQVLPNPHLLAQQPRGQYQSRPASEAGPYFGPY